MRKLARNRDETKETDNKSQKIEDRMRERERDRERLVMGVAQAGDQISLNTIQHCYTRAPISVEPTVAGTYQTLTRQTIGQLSYRSW